MRRRRPDRRGRRRDRGHAVGLKVGLKTRWAAGSAGASSIGRPSARHFGRPPSRTNDVGAPMIRNVHHTRGAEKSRARPRRRRSSASRRCRARRPPRRRPPASAACAAAGLDGVGDARRYRRRRRREYALRHIRGAASRPVLGRCQLPSMMTTSGSSRWSASQSVETNQRESVGHAFLREADADAAVLAALALHLADDQRADLAGGADMGAAAGLQVDVADAHQPHPAGAHRRLDLHRLDEVGIGEQFLVADPLVGDRMVGGDQRIEPLLDLLLGGTSPSMSKSSRPSSARSGRR